MSFLPRNLNDFWTDTDIFELRLLGSQKTPTREIAIKLCRSEEAVEKKAKEIGISLEASSEGAN